MPPVDFLEIPQGTRPPYVFVEIDPSQAGVGPAIQQYRVLCAGQRLSAGTVAQNTLFRATSADQVGKAFGFGSIVHGMAIAFFRSNRFTEAYFVGIDDAGGATQGTQTLTITGTATANGTLYLYIAGRRITVPIVSGDVQNTIATNVAAAITASEFAAELPMTAGAATNVVTLTARNGGTQGNTIDVRLNRNDGEAVPAGVTVVIAAGVTGATDPSSSGAITAMGDLQFHLIAVGLNDATTVDAWHAALRTRFGPIEQKDGHAVFCRDDTHSNLVTFGQARNGRHTTTIGVFNFESPTWEVAASGMGIVAAKVQEDPARPVTTLELVGIVGCIPSDRFDFTERDLLLKNGIATAIPDDLGVVRWERMITHERLNAQGAATTAFLDYNTLATLSFLRWDARTQYSSTYPRMKLADDGTRYGPGQPIVTPKVLRGFFLGLFRQWEQRGLVEGFEQFEQDLVVERSATDRNRVDVVLPPDLVNALLVTGVSIRFLQ